MFERAVARSPIALLAGTEEVAGWQVGCGRNIAAPLRLSDWTALAKVLVHGPERGRLAKALGCGHGYAVRDVAGRLVVGAAPGEWLVFAPPGTAGAVLAWAAALGTEAGEPSARVDLTHGQALIRLTGQAASELLAKVCAIDLADDITPDGTALRTSVAQLTTHVVRDDDDGRTSYLLHCDRGYGQYLFDTLLDAGREYGVEVDGYTGPRH